MMKILKKLINGKGLKRTLALLAAGFLISPTMAVNGILEWRFRSGYVMSQGLIYDEASEKPIFAEYDESGNLVGDIGVARDELEKAYVMSGYGYHNIAEYFKKFKEDNEDGVARGAYILSAEAYRDQQFTTKDGQAITDDAKGEIFPGVKSVYVKSNDLLLIPENEPMLLQVPIDLNDVREIDPLAIKSVLLNEQGQVVRMSSHNIGFKVGYFEGEEDKYTAERGDKIYGPIHLAPVDVGGGAFLGGKGVTDDEGFYTALYMLPSCPGFTFDFTTNNTLTLHYKGFNPRGSKIRSYYLMKPGYDFCSGLGATPPGLSLSGLMAQLAVQSIEATMTTPLYLQNFKVDTAVIGGNGFFSNEQVAEATGEEEPIPDGATVYEYEAPETDPVAETKYDFDGDEETETTVLGNQVEETDENGDPVTRFVADENGELQGVYLSSGSQDPESEDIDKRQPDFVRLADKAADLKDQGLLKTLSEDDFKETDIFIFRESNGKLITKIEGLRDSDFSTRKEGGKDYDTGEFFYSQMIRGPDSAPFDFVDRYSRSGTNWYSAWQSEAEMDPSLHEREADHLRPFEKIRVVAINRKTGYMATIRTEYGKDFRNGIISSLNPDKLVMRPPNLKISAERMYTVEAGLTKDEEREYLIGYEGAALTSDTWVKVTTEWFDHDGSPLPKELEEEGYTGRLAKVSGDNVLTAQGGEFAQFSIKPGRNTENIQITGDGTLSEHFYVQVSGEQKSENPDFSTIGAGEGPLQYRPKYYVPFKVAVADETQTWEQYTAYKKFKRDNPGQEIEKPDPIYKWFYRPEMQFSLYDLEMKNIFRVDEENGSETSVTIYNNEQPVVASSDDLIKILYNLIEKEMSPLDFFGAGQELVFALGEEEVKAEFGSDKQMRFENLEHLSSLDVEDFLSLRLYSNNDPGNILWEYAFEYLVLDTRYVGYDNIEVDEDTGDTTYYISADEPEFPLLAYLVGYSGRDEEYRTPVNFEWRVDSGQGTLENIETNSDAGVATADLKMQPTKNFRAKVMVKLPDSDTEAEFGTVEVLAGKPASMQVTLDGEAFILGHGAIDVNIDVYDQHGNRVEDDTSVELSVSGNAIIADYEPGTLNGNVTAQLKGNNKGQLVNELTVKAGDLEEVYQFEIKPFDIQFVSTPSSFESEQLVPISVRVTADGEAISGADVTFFSTMGKLDSNPVVTDGNGVATKNFHTGFSPTNGELFARVGLEAVKMPSVDINPPADSKIDAYKALVVGDESTDGTVEYERFDGANMGMTYKTSTDISLNGAAGDSITLQLGDLADPNLSPLAAFYMKEIESESTGVTLAKEETGLHRGVIDGDVIVSNDSPSGVGKSYHFESDGHILLDPHAALMPPTALGFRVDIKPDSQSGEIFNLESGSQSLAFSGNRLVFSVKTTDGSFQIQSQPIPEDQWSTIAGRVYNGQLEIEVNGQSSAPVAVTGALEYSSGRGLKIGDGYSGGMNSFRLYDWASAPLLTFDDGSTSKTENFVGAGSVSYTVQSSGNLNQVAAGSALQSMRVAIRQGSERQYIGVISKEYFKEMAGYIATTQSISALPIDFAYQDGFTPNSFLILNGLAPRAHAGIIDWFLEDAWDLVVDIIGFIIPYEEAASFVKQMWYLLSGDDDFDPFELAISTVGILTFFPVAKPLKPLLGPIRKIFASVRGRPFLKAFGEVMGKFGDDLMRGKFDRVLNTLPFLLILGEMAANEESREALTAILDSIVSADDFFTWVEYIGFPTDGWDGDTVPQVELDTASIDNSYISNLVAPHAIATSRSRLGRRVDASILTNTINQAVKRMNIVNSAAAKKLTQNVKSVSKAMKNTDLPSLRKLTHSPYILVAANGVKRKAFQKFMQFSRNFRMSPLSIIAVTAYLETHMYDNCAEVYAECKPFPEAIRNKLNTQMAEAFANPLEDDNYVSGRNIGGLFHLAMLAQKQLAYEVTQDEKKKPVGIEVSKKISLVMKKAPLPAREYTSLKRRVDILLKGSAGDDITGSGHVWVEVKSLKKKPNLNDWNKWTMSKSVYSYHRQFYLDRVGSASSNFNSSIKSDDFEWWLQFYRKSNTNKSYEQADVDKIIRKIRILPTAQSNNMDYVSLDYSSARQNAASFMFSVAKSKFKLRNIKTWLLDEAKDYLLDGLEDDVIDELINH
ncbi:hypothetical protein [Aliikangiella coralliicola]|uniref:Uncharacterized protein n=1 Tax=Aliikangiella coralliicola TaxID=2592383 RepID=A0A545UD97_9GAMM|nr:hypothetical protein [Aliikangiella coralliicola]TQV87444.1 hypothetical protein FLL46_13455 [Aliikangiella coralliicola]